jgi:DNA primase
LHHEEKGFSLVVYADHWRCFGKCGRGGDAIAWLQEYHNLSFQQACERLAAGETPQLARPHIFQRSQFPALSEPPPADWRQSAETVVQQAMDTLWGKAGERARRYLVVERGLTEDVIRRAGLGYVPGDYRAWQTIEGLKVPCGVAIPWFADGVIWGVKVRRAAGDQRYQQVGGGNLAGCLYLADDILPGMPIFLTEGEFDALIAGQAGAGLICPIAIGSAAHKRINARWFPKLIAAPRILACMDDDAAGENAAEEIARLSGAVRRIRVPFGKDVNDFYRLAGASAVQDWIRMNLA